MPLFTSFTASHGRRLSEQYGESELTEFLKDQVRKTIAEMQKKAGRDFAACIEFYSSRVKQHSNQSPRIVLNVIDESPIKKYRQSRAAKITRLGKLQ